MPEVFFAILAKIIWSAIGTNWLKSEVRIPTLTHVVTRISVLFKFKTENISKNWNYVIRWLRMSVIITL